MQGNPEVGVQIVRDLEQIDDWFSFHTPDARQVHLLEEARAQFRSIAAWLVTNIANSRERALALSELRAVARTVNTAVIFDRGDQ